MTFDEIVRINDIGKKSNKSSLNNILKKAAWEEKPNKEEVKEKVLLIGIDFQRDFIDEIGSLAVAGSLQDIYNFLRFFYENFFEISDVILTGDSHNPSQIFHSGWWENERGVNPSDFKSIYYDDIENGKYKPLYYKAESIEYLKYLKENENRSLVIWPYHCIEGTEGALIEPQIMNMYYVHQIVMNKKHNILFKSQTQLAEMEGAFALDHPGGSDFENTDILNEMKNYDKIIIAGESKSHCVLESVKQMLKFHNYDKDFASKIYILEDCMSSLKGFEDFAEEEFKKMEKEYKINIVNSINFKL